MYMCTLFQFHWLTCMYIMYLVIHTYCLSSFINVSTPTWCTLPLICPPGLSRERQWERWRLLQAYTRGDEHPNSVAVTTQDWSKVQKRYTHSLFVVMTSLRIIAHTCTCNYVVWYTDVLCIYLHILSTKIGWSITVWVTSLEYTHHVSIKYQSYTLNLTFTNITHPYYLPPTHQLVCSHHTHLSLPTPPQIPRWRCWDCLRLCRKLGSSFWLTWTPNPRVWPSRLTSHALSTLMWLGRREPTSRKVANCFHGYM